MVEYVGMGDRKKMTKQRATRIFLDKNGICFICRTQIRAHVDKWFIEHPEAVNLGGSDDDKDLWPAHYRCKPGKDKEDAGKIAERNSAITKNFTGKTTSQPMPGSRNSKLKKKMSGEVVER